MKLSIALAGLIDREDWVAEIWADETELLGEIRREGEGFRVQLYPRQSGAWWDLPLDEFISTLHLAREELLPSEGAR